MPDASRKPLRTEPARSGTRRVGVASTLLAGLMSLAMPLACDQRFEFDRPDVTPDGSVAGNAGAGPLPGSGGSAGSSGDSGAPPPTLPPCRVDGDCGLLTLHCDGTTGACVECVLDADCTSLGLARCDGVIRRCVECGLDQDCGDERRCDPRARRCVQACQEDDQCSGADAHCDDGRCVECEPREPGEDLESGAESCAASVAGPFCAPEHLCSECLLDAHCSGEAPLCDRLLGRCVACSTTRDCSGLAVCDPGNHTCVAP